MNRSRGPMGPRVPGRHRVVGWIPVKGQGGQGVEGEDEPRLLRAGDGGLGAGPGPGGDLGWERGLD